MGQTAPRQPWLAAAKKISHDDRAEYELRIPLLLLSTGVGVRISGS
jgi:hypothetical protein